MTLKRTLTIAAALFAALATTAVAAPSPTASLQIRHQVRGCHTWALDGGAFKASQTLVLARGGSLRITNNDMMPHTLVQTSGPAALLTNIPTPVTLGKKGPSPAGTMPHMGAITKVTFKQAGVYVFTTKAGEDYMPMKTTGEDNVLRLVVTVR